MKEGGKRPADTARIDRGEWGFSLLDSDWRALCQVLFGGVEQEDRESMYNRI